MKQAAVWSWSGGGAILAAAAVTGALTLGAQRDLDEAVETEGVSAETVDDKAESLERLALTTDILIASGAVAVVIGTVFWLVDHKAQKKDRAGPASGRSGIARARPVFGARGALLNVSF